MSTSASFKHTKRLYCYECGPAHKAARMFVNMTAGWNINFSPAFPSTYCLNKFSHP